MISRILPVFVHQAVSEDGARTDDMYKHILIVKDQMPAEGIVAAAEEAACDLIVMASHGRRGVARMLLGSQAQKVVTLSPVSVLVCR